jgi:hypothetical protein
MIVVVSPGVETWVSFVVVDFSAHPMVAAENILRTRIKARNCFMFRLVH